MSIIETDIVTLTPTPDDIRQAVQYAIKSGEAYTYNRMNKDTWRRVARIARGKVNESIFSRYMEFLGIRSSSEKKSYRQYDAFDFILHGKHEEIKLDVKTFHVLSQFIALPRNPFSLSALLSSTKQRSDEWAWLFPMLVPLDYNKHKDIYVFAVSVEDKPDRLSISAIEHPWLVFPEREHETFLANPEDIRRRERSRLGLNVTINWSPNMQGTGRAIYERDGQAMFKPLTFHGSYQTLLVNISSFLAIQLNDTAKNYLEKQKRTLELTAYETNGKSISIQIGANQYHEVFPRQGYTLYLLGWINSDEFVELSQILPQGSPCYFYPAAESGPMHAPGTKTDNRYVLPCELYPIQSLIARVS